MATLEKIRNRAALLIIVIGVALFAFIIGDGLRSGGTLFQMNRNFALKIDGEKIDAQEYSTRLAEIQEAQTRSGYQLSDEDRMRINNQLADEYIQTATYNKVAEAIGLTVSPEEQIAAITGEGIGQSYQAMQFFQMLGVDPLDRAAVQNMALQISQNNIPGVPQEQMVMVRQYWQALLDGIRMERLNSKLNAIMSRSFAINKIDAEYLSETPSRRVAIVRTPSTILSDTTVKATDKDVEAYYKKHPLEFEQKDPYTLAHYIHVTVRPSAQDYADSKAQMESLRNKMLNATDAGTVVRSTSNAFAPNYYLSSKELNNTGIASDLVSFVEGAAVGEVNNPALLSDNYALIKLVDKKTAPEGIHARVILLDSLRAAKADSLTAAINAGASFADLAKEYSIDPAAKENGGYITVPNASGMADSVLTEAWVASQRLDTLYQAPQGKAFVKKLAPNAVAILQVTKILPSVTKYKVAHGNIPVTFSDNTFREKYAAINDLLMNYKNFDDMATAAEKNGLEVVRSARISPRDGSLRNIPNSREVVKWMLTGEVGAISERVSRCGDADLVIASVEKHVEAGLIPLEEVKSAIQDRLTMENRGEKLAENLKAQKLTSLEAYATAMQATVDTLENISRAYRGESPMLNAKVMTTPIGKISAPFRAKTEVMVVQPINEITSPVGESEASQLAQTRRSMGQMLGYRSLQYLRNHISVQDNRSRFF